jgi:hypothetical protein
MEVTRTQRSIKCTKPSPFEGATFFKIPANGKNVMRAVKTVGEKWVRENKT